PRLAQRLAHVKFRCRDAIDVIQEHDQNDTLFYLDPPYLHRTRTARRVYRYEMDDKAHAELIDSVRHCRSMIMLSGDSDSLYDKRLNGWERITFATPNHSGQGQIKQRRTEALWIKPDCAECSPKLRGQEIQRLFQW